MLKFFNLSIFLTTLGIVSVTHAGITDYDGLDSFFQPGRGPKRSVGLENTLLKNSSDENEIDKLLNTIDTALLKLKEILRKRTNNGEANTDETLGNESSSPSPYNTKPLSKPNSLKSPSKNGMSSPKGPFGSNLLGMSGSFGPQFVMPEEQPPEPHDYEAPVGLTDEEARIIRQDVLKRTNQYRKQHGLTSLKLNEDMNNHAQEWANYLSTQSSIRHRSKSDNSIYGENIFASSPMEKVGEIAVDSWYFELRHVRVGDGEYELSAGPRGVVGHLTQLLWKKSENMGVGVAKKSDGHYVIVANYNPRGNVIPFFMDNLPEFTQDEIDAAETANNALDEKINTPKVTIKRYSSGSLSSLSGQNSPFGNSQLMSSLLGSSPFGNSPLGTMQRGPSFRRLQ